eukprot:m.1084572 g.1084572  ORF g.1084572 m.1084572 type:complete len:1017 (+) comp24273_c0_seq5:157-3207(+)
MAARGKRNGLHGGARYAPPIARTSLQQSTPHLRGTPRGQRHGGFNASMLSVTQTPGSANISMIGDSTGRTIAGNDHINVEALQAFPIPVKVALNDARAKTLGQFTAGIDADWGLSWLVVADHQIDGKYIRPQLLVWNSHNIDTDSRTVGYLRDRGARSLTIPNSAGKVKTASCVCAVGSATSTQRGSSSVVGLVAVTDGGVVVYWPDVAKDTHLTITISFGAVDDRAHTIVAGKDIECGCVLATANGQLFQIGTRNAYGRPNLSYRHMSQGGGLLQWGMRSLFGFGGGAGGDEGGTLTVLSRRKQQTAGTGVDIGSTANEVVVLSTAQVSFWTLYSVQPPQFMCAERVSDADGRAVEPTLQQLVGGDRVELVDMCARADNSVLVLVVVSPSSGVQSRCVVGQCHLVAADEGNGCSAKGVWSWEQVPFLIPYHPPTPNGMAQVRLLSSGGSVVAADVSLVNMATGLVLPIVGAAAATSSEEGVFVNHGETRPLLGAAVLADDTVVMTDREGGMLVRVAQPDVRQQQEAERIARDVKAQAIHLPAESQDGEFLHAAFGKFCTGDASGAVRLLSEVDNVGEAVRTLSMDIANANPADPRWAEEAATRGQSDMASQILLHQLQAKAREHALLLEFLVALTSPPVWDTQLSASTRRILLDNTEKIAAAIALRELHPKPRAQMPTTAHHVSDRNREFLDVVIHRAVARAGANGDAARTANDVYYQRVTAIDGMLGRTGPLLATEQEELRKFHKWAESRRLLYVASDVLITMVREAGAVRAQTGTARLYQPTTGTTSHGAGGWVTTDAFRESLREQFRMLVEVGVKGDCPKEDLPGVYSRLYDIGNGLLSGYATTDAHAESGSPDHVQFEEDRSLVLAPFLEPQCSQRFRAYQLAEAHHDYMTLVRLCEEDGDTNQLDRLARQFGAPFVECKFRYYVDQGKRFKLLTSGVRSTTDNHHLGHFLQAHNTLGWVQAIHNNDYRGASDVLQKLAMEEQSRVDRKRTMLSLAKLNVVAPLSCREPLS